MKESFILSEEYPLLCSNCFKTYVKIKELGTYVIDKDITCPKCKNSFSHYESVFDGNGYTAYCGCTHCELNYAIILHDDGLIEIKPINHIAIYNDYDEVLSQ